MRVEIVGPPGAGKSTFAPKLATELGARHVDLGFRRTLSGRQLGIWERRVHWGWSFVRRPRLAAAVLPWIRRSRAVMRGALDVPRRDLLVSRLGESAVVDEGPVHAVLWPSALSGSTPDLERIARSLWTPDVLLNVTAPAELVISRVQAARDRPWMDGFTHDEAVEAMVRYERLSVGMASAMGVPVVEVDGRGEMATPDVVDAILRHATP